MPRNDIQKQGRILMLPVDCIEPSPYQARTAFDEPEIAALAVSILQNGLLQPISVRRVGLHKYQLVAGERRLRACRLAKLDKVPAILADYDDSESAALGLLENLQRSQLDPFDTARGIKEVIRLWGCTQAEAARRLGLSQPALANKLRLLTLTPEQQQLCTASHLSERHARAALRLPEGRRTAALEKIKNAILNLSDDQVKAIVDQKMASDEIQAVIAQNIESKMASDEIKATIDENVEKQMAADEIKAAIESEIQKQMSADSVKKTVDDEVAAQMKSDKVQAIYNQNVEEQMASADVKKLIDQNIDEQMKSEKVKKIIEEKIVENRSSREYLDAVAEAMEENGENGAAYQALVELRDTLDDICEFYEGVVDYTDAVGQAAEGALKLKDGAAELLDGMNDLYDGLNTLDEEAVQKILDALNGDYAELKDRAEAMLNMTRGYASYAGIAEGKTGSVQFLIRTAGI